MLPRMFQDSSARSGGFSRGLGSHFKRGSRSGEPWWTQLDGYPVYSEEDIMEQFITSDEMSGLEKRILKKFTLDPENLELMEKLKPEDANELLSWHQKVSDFLRHRQTMDEKLRARESMHERLAKRKTMAILESTDRDAEDGEDLADEVDDLDEASSAGIESPPETPAMRLKKSELLKVPELSQADILVKQRMAEANSQRTPKRQAMAKTRLQTAGIGVMNMRKAAVVIADSGTSRRVSRVGR